MKPEFLPNYISKDLFSILLNEVAWTNRGSPRDECFMAMNGAPDTYSYGNNNEFREAKHTYNAVEMHPEVFEVAEKINSEFNTSYNVCVLNYYKNEHQHLGWHADDSPEQDLSHPIAVVAFGAPRFIWFKEKKFKGDIPEENKILMTPGSLFVMPGGFQDLYFHRIPKHDRPCTGRISLTFRKLVR